MVRISLPDVAVLGTGTSIPARKSTVRDSWYFLESEQYSREKVTGRGEKLRKHKAKSFIPSVINALMAAEDVLIPIEVDDNTMEGMKELLEQIEEVKEEANPDLKTVKCFVTKYQKRNEAHRQGAEIVKKWYPTMETMIRFSVVVAKSTFVRTPVTLYSPRSAAAEDYEKLVTEYLNMIGGNENGEI